MENKGEVVRGHLLDKGLSKPVVLGQLRHFFQVPHAPFWVLHAKTAIEPLIGQGRMVAVAPEWAIQIKHTGGWQQMRRTAHQANRRFPGRDMDHVDADNRVRPLNWPGVCRSVEGYGR